MEYFGPKLKALRKSRKMTQLDLANKLGVSKSTITSYEQGRNSPSVEALMKICDLLQVSSDYMLGIQDELSEKMGQVDLSEEESSLLLQFLDLFKRNREAQKE